MSNIKKGIHVVYDKSNGNMIDFSVGEIVNTGIGEDTYHILDVIDNKYYKIHEKDIVVIEDKMEGINLDALLEIYVEMNEE